LGEADKRVMDLFDADNMDAAGYEDIFSSAAGVQIAALATNKHFSMFYAYGFLFGTFVALLSRAQEAGPSVDEAAASFRLFDEGIREMAHGPKEVN